MHQAAKRTGRATAVWAVAVGGIVALSALVIGHRQASSQQPTAAPAGTPAAPPPAGAVETGAVESWDVQYMAGVKVGYSHDTRQQIVEEGHKLERVDSQAQITFLRMGQSLTLKMRLTSVETLEGRLRRFESEVNMGPTPTIARGEVEGDHLNIELSTLGKTTHSAIPWPADGGGALAMESSLIRQPLRPGETRQIKMLMPFVNGLAENSLTAVDYEPTRLLDGKTQRLLRVVRKTKVSGQSLPPSLFWTDEQGNVLKVREPTMQGETFRTTREVALKVDNSPPPDLLELTLIKVNPAPKAPHDARRIVYRVTLKDGDPAKVFPSSASQSVKSLGPHEAEITVQHIRPGDGHAKSTDPGPTDADSQPNNMIQSDDEGVVKMARVPAPGETDPWKLAVALENHVHRSMRVADYSQAMASAAEVAKSRKGDCKGYAMLLAGLARARGIPARVAVGLVYAPSIGGFAYHMWTEMWIRGEWIPLDATLARGGIGCGHLKLADTNFSKGSPGGILPVCQVVGQLAIKVVEEQH